MPNEATRSVLEPIVVETTSEQLDRLGIYGEIKRELIKRGIPANEIAFIHDFDTPAKKAQAFADVNAGRLRIMLASTEKAGTGVNMQERLYALHHLDAPWRPSDVEQREGRILRQGNRYESIRIFNYVTENSFDGYMWQTLENKARFIAQILTGEVTSRTAQDVDDLVMTAAQVKAIASGNPRILERVGIEVELARLTRLYSVWRKSRRHLKWEAEAMPARTNEADERVKAHQNALAIRDQAATPNQGFTIKLKHSLDSESEIVFTERSQASEQLERLRRQINAQNNSATQTIGFYRGFQLLAQKQRNLEDAFFTPVTGWFVAPEGKLLYEFKFSESAAGAMQSIDAQMRGLDGHLQRALQAQSELRHKQTQLSIELSKGWEYAPNYEALQKQLAEVTQALATDGSELDETQTCIALDEEARQKCNLPLEPTPQVVAEQPTTITPVFSDSTHLPSEIPPSTPILETDQVDLEKIREQISSFPLRKSSRAGSSAQMSLW